VPLKPGCPTASQVLFTKRMQVACRQVEWREARVSRGRQQLCVLGCKRPATSPAVLAWHSPLAWLPRHTSTNSHEQSTAAQHASHNMCSMAQHSTHSTPQHLPGCPAPHPQTGSSRANAAQHALHKHSMSQHATCLAAPLHIDKHHVGRAII